MSVVTIDAGELELVATTFRNAVQAFDSAFGNVDRHCSCHAPADVASYVAGVQQRARSVLRTVDVSLLNWAADLDRRAGVIREDWLSEYAVPSTASIGTSTASPPPGVNPTVVGPIAGTNSVTTGGLQSSIVFVPGAAAPAPQFAAASQSSIVIVPGGDTLPPTFVAGETGSSIVGVNGAHVLPDGPIMLQTSIPGMSFFDAQAEQHWFVQAADRGLTGTSGEMLGAWSGSPGLAAPTGLNALGERLPGDWDLDGGVLNDPDNFDPRVSGYAAGQDSRPFDDR